MHYLYENNVTNIDFALRSANIKQTSTFQPETGLYVNNIGHAEAELYVPKTQPVEQTEFFYQLSHLKSFKGLQQYLAKIQDPASKEALSKLVNDAYTAYSKEKHTKSNIKKYASSANKLANDQQQLINEFVAAVPRLYKATSPYNDIIVYVFPVKEPAQPISFYNTILLPVSNPPNLEEYLGLVMREVSHMHYQNQDINSQLSTEKFFFQSSSPYAYTTYRYLDKALAIVLGQGLFLEALTGKVRGIADHDSSDYLSGLIQALYDDIKTCVQNKTPINESFLEKAIERFAVACPDAPRDIQEVLKRYIVLTKHFDLAEVIGRIYSFFPSKNIFGSPIDDKEEIEKDMQSRGYDNHAPIVCVLTPREVENIEAFVNKNPYLQRVSLDQLKAVPPILNSMDAFLDAQDRVYMFFIVDKLNQLVTLLKVLNKADYLPKEKKHSFSIRPKAQTDNK